ncbi:MAG: DUF1385 domain-containing protein [Actinobacteria bacterium]|nr:DUF1385 domain-containing protein [Actinomycetota bacterium]
MAKTLFGGQAVIEGVMMKGPKYWSLAVRTSDGNITDTGERFKSISERWSIFKKPLFRGIVVLIETFILGIKTISLSANLALGETEEEITPKQMVGTLMLAFAFVVGLFMILPFYLTKAASTLIDNRFLFAFIEGLFRITIFILYILVISRVSDIRRVFEYHGAEHMIIHTYEAGEGLTPQNAARYSTLHVRCGTSFMLIVMVVAIFSFSFLPTTDVLTRVAGKLTLIPLVAGISYEVTRVAARYSNSRFMKAVMAPGLMLQKLTTKKPDESQLEVAIHALNKVLEAEGIKAAVQEEEEKVGESVNRFTDSPVHSCLLVFALQL